MPAKGSHMSAEAKARISSANKGRQTTLGFRHSAESKKKMSDALKGHVIPEEVRLKISQANKGKVRTEEQKKRLSEAKLGVKHSKPHKKGNMWEWTVSEERRKEISNIYKGRKYTDESRLKMAKNHHVSYKLVVDGKEYNSMLEASKILNISYRRFTWLCKHPDIMQEKFGHTLNYIDD